MSSTNSHTSQWILRHAPPYVLAAALLACSGQGHPNTTGQDVWDGGTASDSTIDDEPGDADAYADTAEARDDATDTTDVEPTCQYGYHSFGTCCDDLIFEIVEGQRVPIEEAGIYERFAGCPCDPALPIQRDWWCADLLLGQAMVCGDQDVRRWIQGTVERSDFDGPPLECTWELLASHTGEYPDQGL